MRGSTKASIIAPAAAKRLREIGTASMPRWPRRFQIGGFGRPITQGERPDFEPDLDGRQADLARHTRPATLLFYSLWMRIHK